MGYGGEMCMLDAYAYVCPWWYNRIRYCTSNMDARGLHPLRMPLPSARAEYETTCYMQLTRTYVLDATMVTD